MNVMTVEEMRGAWRRGQRALSEAVHYIQELELPPWAPEPVCCDAPNVIYMEDGFVRSSKTAVEDGVLFGVADGWDDMSEDGFISWLECTTCETVWAVPEGMEWS